MHSLDQDSHRKINDGKIHEKRKVNDVPLRVGATSVLQLSEAIFC